MVIIWDTDMQSNTLSVKHNHQHAAEMTGSAWNCVVKPTFWL